MLGRLNFQRLFFARVNRTIIRTGDQTKKSTEKLREAKKEGEIYFGPLRTSEKILNIGNTALDVRKMQPFLYSK